MRKKEGNKETAILEAAVKIFAENGYHNAKISKIAEVAGVATGSVYLYYKSKEDIILTIFDHLWVRFLGDLKAVVKRTDLSSDQKLDAVIDVMFDALSENPSLAIVFVNEQNHLIQSNKGNVGKQFEEYLDLAEQIIKDGIRKKIFNDKSDIKILRQFLLGGVRTLLHLWASTPEDYPLDLISESVKYFMKHGLAVNSMT